MYEQLLKLETLELAKKAVSWDRLVEIRHLKDRMVRKARRLSPPKSSQHGARISSIIAPDDFRLKEMERWFRQEQIRISSSSQRLRPTDQAHAGSHRDPTTLCPPTFTDEPEHMMSSPSYSPPKALSPEPLPHLLRSSMAMALMNSMMETTDAAPLPTETKTSDSLPKVEPPPKLRRQRSCIKRSYTGDSMNSMKSVSWNLPTPPIEEGIGKFMDISQQAQKLDNDWDEMRHGVYESMDRLEGLEKQLQNERENLRDLLGRFEKKQWDYRAKVQEALNEADNLVSPYGTKEAQADGRTRFMPSINEDSREEPVEPTI
ncbi:hypothetical protein BT96DRAFT_985934 [Gymnopus androsaceus JB14]|uniref:Uncharacterized protein n=1 Tax=Gymnopus androsaceus JB14 TaxID=1447944 RepID=A0A6A4IFW8_9AGAR|nr:hypothetical protein BT96DRAFT_985934 [Gymnopus androsaceus JB14]